mgnify:CR=1 FL=1
MGSFSNIYDIKRINDYDNYIVTKHGWKRFVERGITLNMIHDAIESGEIIEYYDEDKPFPGCLILGCYNNTPIHIVLSLNDDLLFIITAYYPDLKRWEDDYRTIKE